MRPTGQLEKSLAALTIAVKQGGDERAKALADGYTGEHFQQVRVDLSGIATATWGFADQDIAFALPFLWAPSQRAVPFKPPHFTRGFEFKSNPSDLVLLDAHVLSWHETEEGWIVGAKVRFAVQAPNFSTVVLNTVTEPKPGVIAQPDAGLTGVTYSATAHLTFEGYATHAEGNEFDL